MKTLKNAWYDFKIGRKWERLNRELYLQDVADFTAAVKTARKAARMDCKAVKAMHKALVQATR